MRQHYITILKGFLVGATMIIPGISGGSMAMILGIYDRLIASISSFRKNPKEAFLFLMFFSLSALIGMVLFSTPLSWVLKQYPQEAMYFFLGAVFGGIPMIEKKSRIKSFSFDVLFYLFLGFTLVFLFAFLPKDLFSFGQTGISSPLFLIFTGILASAALILPGISISHFFFLLGIYDGLLAAIRSLSIAFLLPLGAGILIGILLFTKMLNFLMEHYPKPAYLTILGFILGSATSIFPGLPKGWSIPICIFLTTAGFYIVSILSRKGNQ